MKIDMKKMYLVIVIAMWLEASCNEHSLFWLLGLSCGIVINKISTVYRLVLCRRPF